MKQSDCSIYQNLCDAADAVVARSGCATTADDLLALAPRISKDTAQEAVEWAMNRLRVIESLEGSK
jgi:predicted esterase